MKKLFAILFLWPVLLTAQNVFYADLTLTNDQRIGTNVAAAASWLPSTETGLCFWVSSDTGVTNNANSSSPSTGDTIKGWKDLSGSNACAYMATSTKQPIFTNSVLNGKPGIYFDGTDDEFAVAPGVVNHGTNWSLFLQGDFSGLKYGRVFGLDFAHSFYTAANWININDNGTHRALLDGSLSGYGGPVVYGLVVSNLTVYFYTNFILVGYDSTPSTWASSQYIMSRGADTFAGGNLFEIAIYNKAFTTTSSAWGSVSNYFRSRY